MWCVCVCGFVWDYFFFTFFLCAEPCTCPQSLVDARRVWGSVHRPSDDALTSLVASTVTTPKASPPPRLSMPSQPDNRSVLATVGSITIAGQPLQSADPALANVLSRAVGVLPSAASAHHKVEALRMHLEQQLGLRTLVAAHKAIQRSESGLASEAEVDEELLSIVGYHNLSAIPALRQLVGAEESLGMST